MIKLASPFNPLRFNIAGKRCCAGPKFLHHPAALSLWSTILNLGGRGGFCCEREMDTHNISPGGAKTLDEAVKTSLKTNSLLDLLNSVYAVTVIHAFLSS